MTPLPEGRFWLEAPLNPDIGNAGVGFTFARRSTVSLSNAWGEVRQGRDETATYYNTGHFDPFGDTGLGAAGNLTVKPSAVPVGGRLRHAGSRQQQTRPLHAARRGRRPVRAVAANGDSQGAEFGVMHSFRYSVLAGALPAAAASGTACRPAYANRIEWRQALNWTS